VTIHADFQKDNRHCMQKTVCSAGKSQNIAWGETQMTSHVHTSLCIGLLVLAFGCSCRTDRFRNPPSPEFVEAEIQEADVPSGIQEIISNMVEENESYKVFEVRIFDVQVYDEVIEYRVVIEKESGRIEHRITSNGVVIQPN